MGRSRSGESIAPFSQLAAHCSGAHKSARWLRVVRLSGPGGTGGHGAARGDRTERRLGEGHPVRHTSGGEGWPLEIVRFKSAFVSRQCAPLVSIGPVGFGASQMMQEAKSRQTAMTPNMSRVASITLWPSTI